MPGLKIWYATVLSTLMASNILFMRKVTYLVINALKFLDHFHDVVHLVQKPGINTSQVGKFLHRVVLCVIQGSGQGINTLVGRMGQILKNGNVEQLFRENHNVHGIIRSRKTPYKSVTQS